MRDISRIQERVDLTKVSLVPCGQSDGNRVRRHAARRALTGGVDRLGNSRPYREVASYDDVVRQVRFLMPLTQGRALTGLSVSGSL